MATSSFSKRTLAIAVAAGVALSGVQAVAPSAISPFNAPTAVAAEGTGISAADVAFLGIFDANGEVTKSIKAIDNFQPKDASTADEFVTLATNANTKEALLKVAIDLSNAEPGNTIVLQPRNRWSGTFSSNNGTPYSGLRFKTTQPAQPVKAEGAGVEVASLAVQAGGDATLVFSDGVADVKDGKLVISLPVGMAGTYREDPAKESGPSENLPLEGEWKLQAKVGNETTVLDERKIILADVVEQAHRTFTTAWAPTGGISVDSARGTVDFSEVQQRSLYNVDSRVTIRPLSADGLMPWSFANPAVSFKLWQFDETGARIPQEITDAKQIADLGVSMRSVETTDGSIQVEFTGIEGKRLKPILLLTGDLGTLDYEPAGKFGVVATLEDLSNPSAAAKSVDSTYAFPPTPELDAQAQGVTRSAVVDAQLQVDEGEPDGIQEPARIAGRPAKVKFSVKNTGDRAINTVEVVHPNGKSEVRSNLAIQPNETGEFTVDIEKVPASARAIDFRVSIPRTPITKQGQADQTSHAEFTFQVDQTSQYVTNPDGSVTITDPTGKEIVVVSWDEFKKVEERVKALEGKQDVYVVKGQRNDDNSITLTLNNGEKVWIPAASKKGLERCMSGTGGVILALLPVLGLLGAGLSQVKLPGIGEQMEQIQRQAGIYNEDLARFVADNGPAIGTTIGALAAALLLFVPGTCGDMSLAGAIGEASSGSSAKPATDATPAQ